MAEVPPEAGESCVIPYTVHSWSSYCPGFYPDRILENRPEDGKSRWLSEGSKHPQYLTLKLERVAIVESITFGKPDKSHATSLRKLQVYGGMDCEHMHQLLEGGLKTTPDMETFPLQCKLGGKAFPCQYIKILPLQTWGHSFNFSIWYVELRGVMEEAKVQQALADFQQNMESRAVRLCLKHLRQRDYSDAFSALKKKVKVELEHPLLTELHTLLVDDGDFEGTERVMKQAAEEGHLDSYMCSQPVEARWTPVDSSHSTEKGVPVTRPGMRGGHQMCIDPIAELLYLHGGWDGSHDLSDLWRFDVRRGYWVCLQQDTSLVGGPSARSCHSISLDVENQVIYVLGRYLDPAARATLAATSDSTLLPGDFYSYCVDTSMWTLLSSDTYADGGPQLIYDHQMCYSAETQTLYVFGGRILTLDLLSGSRITYSGLYAYHCMDKQWVRIRPDCTGPQYPYTLTPRMAHTMFLHPHRHQLVVMGGQKDKQPLSDMLLYNIPLDETTVLMDGKDTHIPGSGVTFRATLDPQRNEICLLTGLHRTTEDARAEQAANSIWVFDMDTSKWSSVAQGSQPANSRQESLCLPPPRFAHQLIFDPLHQVFYMFGGNPDDRSHQNMRLDDFWMLKLVRHSQEKVLRLCQFLIRKQKFSELAVEEPVRALSFLQTSIAAIVNHDDQEESEEFRKLAATVFTSSQPHSSTDERAAVRTQQRNKLYDELCSYWPEYMCQPRDSLMDLLIDKL